MTVNIGGAGIGLNYPTALYPDQVPNDMSYQPGTNYFSLAPGECQVVPSGQWQITRGAYSTIQYLDPVTGIWRNFSSVRSAGIQLRSDGTNFRIFNPTGCPVAAIVTTQGSAYVQSTTTCVPSAGNSTWYPIIGGAISTTITVVTAGTNYSIPPTVYFPAAPSPGVTAQGYATLSGGTVSSITVTNCGAGYATAPVPVIIPSPFDPNLGTITTATATSTLTGSAGKLTAVICTNPGTSLSSVPTLTIAGAGTSAAASVVSLCTITASSASGGANYTTSNFVTSVGGQSNATEVAAVLNPAVSLSTYVPRAAYGTATVSGGALTGFTFYDTGLFASSNFSSNQPTLVVVNNTGGSAASGALTLGVTLGGANDALAIQAI